MKKIINGRRYDTETAQLVGSTRYSNRTDFYFWEEELYRKKTGEFFLYGEGGPMSKYSRRTGPNQWSGGKEIRPLSLKEAQEWAEKYLDADEYEEVFGRVEEDKIQVSAWIPESVKKDAEALKGYTWADIFTAGIAFLKQNN
jgi:hypothetical protein